MRGVNLFIICQLLILQRWSFGLAWISPATPRSTHRASTAFTGLRQSKNDDTTRHDYDDRRSWFRSLLRSAGMVVVLDGVRPAVAAAETASVVTDRIFLEVKGLGETPQRIVIGLFGRDAPRSTVMLRRLVDVGRGLPAPCKPRAERTLQKEQLEANKVHKNCIDTQDNGVTYEYSQIWRIVPNERIDVGAVAGKFIAREYPTWQEEEEQVTLKHDRPGIVSVRRGNDSGFGFTIYPGNNPEAAAILDQEHIVVGQVENLDIVRELNQVPVITSSKLNYMGLTGGPTTKSAPTRACQYGGPMYCNEYKPLIKLTILNSGVL